MELAPRPNRDVDASQKLLKNLMNSALFKTASPFLQEGWTLAFNTATSREQKACVQLASLPSSGVVDKEWVMGVQRSNQRRFRVLMSIFFHIAGSSSLQCEACQGRVPLKQRNCRVLPPEAQGMRELQQVIGHQCVNCYFFPASRPCELPGRPPALKQTPVPAPLYSQAAQHSSSGSMLPALNSDSTHRWPRESSPRTATKLNKPISQTPVPVPPIPPVRSLPSQLSGQGVGQDHAVLVDAGQSSEDRDGVQQSRKPVTRSSHSLDGATLSALRPTSSSSSASTAAAPFFNASSSSHLPDTQSLATSVPSFTTAPLTSSSLIAKAFTLFGEIGQLPAHEQPGVYQKIAELSEIARRPLIHDTGLDAPFPPSAPAAEDWEVAPGCLSAPKRPTTAAAAGSVPVGFSSSFLRREVVNFEHAPQVSRLQRVMNKHLAPLAVVRIDRAGQEWECTLAVLEGFVKVKMEGVDAKIGQGGLLLIGSGSDCILTNAMHQESKVQIRWTRGT